MLQSNDVRIIRCSPPNAVELAAGSFGILLPLCSVARLRAYYPATQLLLHYLFSAAYTACKKLLTCLLCCCWTFSRHHPETLNGPKILTGSRHVQAVRGVWYLGIWVRFGSGQESDHRLQQELFTVSSSRETFWSIETSPLYCRTGNRSVPERIPGILAITFSP